MRDLRILVITQLFVPLIGGGSENQAIILSKEIANKGCNVTVFARKIKGGFSQGDENTNGIKVTRLWNINWSLIRRGEERLLLRLFSNVSYAASLVLALILNRKKFDIVHYFGAGILTALTAPVVKILKKKSIAHVTGLSGVEAGSMLTGKFSFIKGPFIFLINFVDIFRASGSAIEKGLIKDGIGIEKIVGIPNLVDTNIFKPAESSIKEELRVKLSLPLKDKIGIFSGILIKSKAVDFLIRIWKIALESRKDLYLVILGDGPDRKCLEDLSTQLCLGERVSFRGLVSNVNEYLQASDIFIFSSKSEGTPNALIEAMACGLPVLTTKVGNLVDFIKDGVNGIFFDINDLKGSALKLQMVLSDQVLCKKLSYHARRIVQDNNNPEVVCSKYIHLYKRLLS